MQAEKNQKIDQIIRRLIKEGNQGKPEINSVPDGFGFQQTEIAEHCKEHKLKAGYMTSWKMPVMKWNKGKENSCQYASVFALREFLKEQKSEESGQCKGQDAYPVKEARDAFRGSSNCLKRE